MNATLDTNQDVQFATPLPVVPVEPEAPKTTTARLVSLDAYRGLAMVLMASAGLGLSAVAKSFPNSATWHQLGYHTDHAPWTGCTLWDLIQPGFMFMVGAAIPFSIASRKAKGQGFIRMFFHALWRSLALIALGVLLASESRQYKQTNWAFTNVLAQIGLGYLFLFLLAWLKPRWQLVTAVCILFFCWLAFALYPATPTNFDFATVNAKNWPHALSGFGAHWDKNTNFATYVDQKFLNQFPRQEPFVGNEGGYTTLNFVPALATMIFGLLAGHLLQSTTITRARKILILLATGALGLGLGFLLDYTGVCPMVKRIWTPSFALFSAGWVLIGLAAFYLILDVIRLRFWAFPLVIVGMNSIAFYLLFQLPRGWIRDNIQRHAGQHIFDHAGLYAPLAQTATLLVVLWLIALWMHRRRIYLRI